ncbi:pilus assembly protein [Sphingomonas ginkgonis]|uniref:Pilus assembly protein n=1 Tax=Sphingomonas ginkgonis TaxID=2315330 RepID=A0A429V732_9SPHN|nr:pilus assembly protein TadG-related protein [Sphingomonas ginkgonis]RST29697.1 pilus assembly protein [Sphingomonas ginkgonis]
MKSSVRRFADSSSGAVAPTVALSLFALIAAGGIAFDYARLAAMDTELQQAADHAALAAATQLDKQSGAILRATAAAQALIRNETRFGISDATSGTRVTVPEVVFCSAFNDATADEASACTTTTSDSSARYVIVKVGQRAARYALTPIVGLLASGNVGAHAVAGLSSAICKEPPVMMCNPAASSSAFDVDSYIGKGIRLIATGGGGSYAPGDFGFLDVGAGASDLAKLMGYGSSNFECVDVTQPSTEPGSLSSVINEFNTRFDIFESGDSINCYSGSKCPPSINSRKDLVLKSGSDPTKLGDCGLVTGGGTKGWTVSNTPYRPTSATIATYSATPDAMGYPRDKCHAIDNLGNCSGGRIGSGDWDINAYWRVNHQSSIATGGLYPTTFNAAVMAAAPLPATVTRSYPTRYQVYKWETANRAAQLPTAGRAVTGVGTDYGQPVCRSGSIPASTTADRRVLPVAVVNCSGLSGKKPVNPIDWIDVFLIEPSTDRSVTTGSGKSKVTTDYTKKGDIYVEVIGRTSTGTGGTASQFVRRDKAYLIR